MQSNGIVLSSTMYPNTQKIVIGTYTVYTDDSVLLCDTSTAPVIINLLQIPNSGGYLKQGNWSTQYKLYIVDYKNNSATNNITVIAPSGFKINTQQQYVMSTNGGSIIIEITSNLDYVAIGGAGANFLSTINTSTVFMNLANGILQSKVDYQDYALVQLKLSNPNQNYFPITQVYDNVGNILPTYFNDLTYAQTLGNQQAVVGYNANVFHGAFTSANIDLVTGYLTLPTDGVYLIQIRTRIASFGSVGTAAIQSTNPKTVGQMWNSNKSLEAKCSFLIGIQDDFYNGISCQQDEQLTDSGNFILITSVVRPYIAGSKIRALFINNSDLPVYGDSPQRSDFELICYKISEIF